MHKHPTYKNLTFEFLSSYRYNPSAGIFGKECRLRHNELPGLLAFQCDPQAYTEVPVGDHMQWELDFFWGRIIEDYSPDYERMTPRSNP